jgi:hypothetical protein
MINRDLYDDLNDVIEMMEGDEYSQIGFDVPSKIKKLLLDCIINILNTFGEKFSNGEKFLKIPTGEDRIAKLSTTPDEIQEYEFRAVPKYRLPSKIDFQISFSYGEPYMVDVPFGDEDHEILRLYTSVYPKYWKKVSDELKKIFVGKNFNGIKVEKIVFKEWKLFVQLSFYVDE